MSSNSWSPELAATVEQVFRVTDPAAGPVEVVDAAAGVRTGWRVVERYRAWPSTTRARYLFPADAARAARHLLAGYGRLRSRRESVTRAAASLLASGPLRGDELLVTTPCDADTDGVLSRWLASELGLPDVALGVPVRSLDPHSKPTVQLVSRAGTTLGFAKVGATPSARQRVLQEEHGYDLVAGAGEGPLRVPTVLHAGDWCGRRILTTAPVSSRARLADAHRYQESFAVLTALGTEPWDVAGLRDSAYGQDLPTRATRIVEEGIPHARRLADAVDGVLTVDGDAELVHGVLHGDWVPWNLAVEGPLWWAWDLEHARASAPLGLDVVLGLAQQRVHAGSGTSIAAAVDATQQQARAVLATLGVGGRAANAVLRAGRLEVALRAAELYHPLRGWQTGIDEESLLTLLAPLLPRATHPQDPGPTTARTPRDASKETTGE